MYEHREIITDTIDNVNRVLNAWSLEDRRTIRDDELSLFRTYFYRSIKNRLGWRNSKWYMKRYNYIPIISRNRLVGITFENLNGYGLDSTITQLNKEIKAFDFNSYNNSNPLPEMVQTDLVPSEYENILNIKF